MSCAALLYRMKCILEERLSKRGREILQSFLSWLYSFRLLPLLILSPYSSSVFLPIVDSKYPKKNDRMFCQVCFFRWNFVASREFIKFPCITFLLFLCRIMQDNLLNICSSHEKCLSNFHLALCRFYFVIHFVGCFQDHNPLSCTASLDDKSIILLITLLTTLWCDFISICFLLSFKFKTKSCFYACFNLKQIQINQKPTNRFISNDVVTSLTLAPVSLFLCFCINLCISSLYQFNYRLCSLHVVRENFHDGHHP
jgi:hypothetical protein